MENKNYIPKCKMPVSERAKQFAPFSPLNGLSRALRAQERVLVPKPTLCEDQVALLNRVLGMLQRGMEVLVLFHRDAQVRRLQGTVRCVDDAGKRLVLDALVIDFDELLDIRIYLSKDSGEEDFYSDENQDDTAQDTGFPG